MSQAVLYKELIGEVREDVVKMVNHMAVRIEIKKRQRFCGFYFLSKKLNV